MSSPGSVSDDGRMQTPIPRIPTPLGPRYTAEDLNERNKSRSNSQHSLVINFAPDQGPTEQQQQQLQQQQLQNGSVPSEETDDMGNEKKPPLTKPQIYTLCAICFANVCSATFYSLLAPFFPTEAQNKGASPTEVGIILGVFQGIVFISSPFFGTYMTTFGPRFMFITGTLATSTCVILFGLLEWCPSGRIFVIMCLAVRSVEALAAASTTTSSQAIAAHSFPNRLSTVMGVLQACGCIGLMIGPPVGGALYALGGFKLPFLVSGGLFMLGGIVSCFLLPPQTVEQKATIAGSKLALLKIPIITVIGLLTASGQFAMGFIDVALANMLTKFHLYPAITGLVFLIPPVIVVLLAPIVGWMTDKLKWLNKPILVFGGVVGAAGFLLLGPTPFLSFLPKDTLWLVIVGLAVSGFGWSSMVVCYPEYVKAAHDHGFPKSMETQGLVSGVFNAYNSLGSLLGPTIAGVLVEKYKFPWASTIVAGIIAFSCIILILYIIVDASISYCRNIGKNKLNEKTNLIDDDQ